MSKKYSALVEILVTAGKGRTMPFWCGGSMAVARKAVSTLEDSLPPSL